jgi:DNA polymerase III subunit delta'
VKLRVAPATARLLDVVTSSQPHALLLIGPEGVGLHTLARHIATTTGTLYAEIVPESNKGAVPAISVDRIRQLYVETRTRLSGVNTIIIDNADTMNHVAQNALLKLLEEPNESVRFILTSHAPDKLLPTIRSRSQQNSVPPISDIESNRLLKNLGITDDLTIQRLLYVAQGLPAELTRLIEKQADFAALSTRVQQARLVIEGTPYVRMAAVMAADLERKDALLFISTVLLLLRRSLVTRPDTSTIRRIEKLVVASEEIRKNGNIKLHLVNAVL